MRGRAAGRVSTTRQARGQPSHLNTPHTRDGESRPGCHGRPVSLPHLKSSQARGGGPLGVSTRSSVGTGWTPPPAPGPTEVGTGLTCRNLACPKASPGPSPTPVTSCLFSLQRSMAPTNAPSVLNARSVPNVHVSHPASSSAPRGWTSPRSGLGAWGRGMHGCPRGGPPRR